MDTMVDYQSIVLNNFRSFIYDSIMIYGFTAGESTTGIVKATLKILDGLR